MHQLLTVSAVAERLAVSERTVKLNEATPVMMTFDEWITETYGPDHGLSGSEISIAREAWGAAHEQCATTYGSSKAADEIDRLRAALRQVAQSHAWIAFGECRSFGCDVPLLQPHQADALAKEVLKWQAA